MFIKNGDGKIISVVDEESLTEKQKKTAQESLDKLVKTNEQHSNTKDSGR